jgi:hypothetical protein
LPCKMAETVPFALVLEWLDIRDLVAVWMTTPEVMDSMSNWAAAKLRGRVFFCDGCFNPLGVTLCPACTHRTGRMWWATLCPLVTWSLTENPWRTRNGTERFWTYFQIFWEARTRRRGDVCALDTAAIHPLDFVKHKLAVKPMAFIAHPVCYSPSLPSTLLEIARQ